MKILLISGHGAGDPGAGGNGYNEADLTRKATYILQDKLKAYDVAVTKYPVSHDCYQDLKAGKAYYNLKNYDLVIEVHFNAAGASAKGTEVLYRDSKAKGIAEKICATFAKRGFVNRGAKVRTDLLVMNRCYQLGVPQILIETCFITNKADMTLYMNNLYSVWGDVATTIANYYGLKKKQSKPVNTAKKYAEGTVASKTGVRVHSAPAWTKTTSEVIPYNTKLYCYGTHNAVGFEWWAINEAKTKWVRKTSLTNRKSL